MVRSASPGKTDRHHGKIKVMTLAADEFMRRFLLHAVPDGFHRIRHLGFLANGHRTGKLARSLSLTSASAWPSACRSSAKRAASPRWLVGSLLSCHPEEPTPLPRHAAVGRKSLSGSPAARRGRRRSPHNAHSACGTRFSSIRLQ